MQLDVKAFAEKLKMVERTMPTLYTELDTDGLKYLYKLLDKFTEEITPMYISDIDFNSFTADDIDYFQVFLERTGQRMYENGKIAKVFCTAQPKAYNPAVRFF